MRGGYLLQLFNPRNYFSTCLSDPAFHLRVLQLRKGSLIDFNPPLPAVIGHGRSVPSETPLLLHVFEAHLSQMRQRTLSGIEPTNYRVCATFTRLLAGGRPSVVSRNEANPATLACFACDAPNMLHRP